jgi:hypothetical protein
MMAASRFSLFTLALTCVLWMHPSALSAQSGTDATVPIEITVATEYGDFPLFKPTGCMANIPSASMHRVPVLLSASVMRRSDSAFSLQADLLAQDVAAELRSQLGGSDSAITVQDDHLPWYSVPTTIVVAARKNGEMSANQFVIGGDSTATLLLLQAFKAARAHGGAMMAWPEDFTKDTVWVRLDLWPNYVDAATKKELPIRRESGFPVFSLTEPEQSPALPLPTKTKPKYPAGNELTRYSGTVLMQLTVDTAGRAVPATIRDLWPKGRPRLEGRDAGAYDAFVSSIANWLTTVRFEPARFGPCAKRQLVQWPFEFKMPGRK